MQISLDYFYTFLFVFVRMCGMILFNPLFSRRNVPTMIRMALVLGLSFVIAPTLDTLNVGGMLELEIVVTILQELFVGFVCGFVFQIFNYLLFFVGDFLDMQFGMSMSKAFDPSSNIQISVTSNYLQLYFILYILCTDSHLVLIRLYAASYKLLPMASPIAYEQIAQFMVTLFTSTFVLVLRLAMPFFAAEFTMEVAMGILMKLIPQIHVFVINIQTKLFLALLLLTLFTVAMSGFMDNFINIMLQNMQAAISQLAGA